MSLDSSKNERGPSECGAGANKHRDAALPAVLRGPLLVVAGNLPWSFIVAPVLAGATMLTAFALVWHRFVLRKSWPVRWL